MVCITFLSLLLLLIFQNMVLQFWKQTSVRRLHIRVHVCHYKCGNDSFWPQSNVCFLGCEHLQNDHGVIVDYNTSDPLIRWDSYENVSPDGEGE